MYLEEKKQSIEVEIGSRVEGMDDLRFLLKKCVDQGIPLIAVSRATKLSEAELQDYLNGVMPSDFSRIEYLNIFLILLLNEKPVSDSYYRGLLEE